MQELPEQVGVELANWYWKGVRQFVSERFGIELSRSSCLNYLHRLGFDRLNYPSFQRCLTEMDPEFRTGRQVRVPLLN